MKSILFALLFLPAIAGAQIISTYAGSTAGTGADGGPATNANLNFAYSVTTDKQDNVYVSQWQFNRIRKIDAATGIISHYAGIGVTTVPLGDDGPATDANINMPLGITCDTAGNLYIAERQNYRVRKVNAATGIITTVAGSGIHDDYGGTGDGGQATAATFNTPADVRVDKNGDLLIADNSAHRIRKVNLTTGIISHFAGTATLSPGHSGDDGPASAAQMKDPKFITLDDDGNVYVAEQRYLRKINAATGVITTVAGTGAWMFNGDTVHAMSINISPTGLVYHNNALYFGELEDRMRKLNLSNDTVYTICGNGTELHSGDGGPAINATVFNPQGMTSRGCFELLFADEGNMRVRKIELPTVLLTPTVTLTGDHTGYIGFTVTVNATVTGAGSDYVIRWMNHGILFATTTVPTVTYVKTMGEDLITARVVPQLTEYSCYDSVTSAQHGVWTEGAVRGVDKSMYNIYPNPVSSTLHIAGADIAAVSIINLLGQTVYSGTYSSKTADVPVAHLPKGMYVLRVNGQIAGKFLKE